MTAHAGGAALAPPPSGSRGSVHKALLVCGILAATLYVTMMQARTAPCALWVA